MTGVIDTGLDALGEGDTTLGSHVFVLLVDFRLLAEGVGAEVSVLGQVRKSIRALVTGKSRSLFFAVVFLIAAALLDPVRELSERGSETFRRIGHFVVLKSLDKSSFQIDSFYSFEWRLLV